MSSRADAKQAARQARLAAEHEASAQAARARRLKILLAALAGAAIIVIVAVVASSGGGGGSSTTKAVSAPKTQSLFAGIPQQGTTLGDPKAKVTLTEFADLQCPYCKAYAADQLPSVIRSYVRTGKARVVFRNLSFIGPDSVKAAKFAAAAALQGKLFEFIDRFYANQQTENTGYVTDGFLRKVAGEVPGLNVDKAFADAQSPQAQAQLAKANAAAQALGVNSTPAFVLNGKKYDANTVGQALAQATA